MGDTRKGSRDWLRGVGIGRRVGERVFEGGWWLEWMAKGHTQSESRSELLVEGRGCRDAQRSGQEREERARKREFPCTVLAYPGPLPCLIPFISTFPRHIPLSPAPPSAPRLSVSLSVCLSL